MSNNRYWGSWRTPSRDYPDGARCGSAHLRLATATALDELRWMTGTKGTSTVRAGDTAMQLLTGEGITGQLWMSDSCDEFHDCLGAIYSATGRVLVHGLGLGSYLHCILSKPDVTHIDVVENSQDIIDLISPHFAKHNGRLTIHHDDAFTRKWPRGTRWNYVWHDIWATICTGDLAAHTTLLRKFANRTDNQGCWKHEDLRLRLKEGV